MHNAKSKTILLYTNGTVCVGIRNSSTHATFPYSTNNMLTKWDRQNSIIGQENLAFV